MQLALDADSPLAGWQPDVVHGHDWKVGWAADTLARHHGVPFVLTMHGTERVRHGGNLPIGEPTDVNSIEWWLAFRADRLIASTRFMVDQLVTGFELAPDQVICIPNGIDPQLWDGHDRGDREPLIVSWGRVQYEKGFQVLARAMTTLRAQVSNVSCVIAGRGSYLPELQTQIDVEGVSDLIALPGFLGDNELRSLVHPRRLRRNPLAVRAVRCCRVGGTRCRRSAHRGADRRARRADRRHRRRAHLRAWQPPTT